MKRSIALSAAILLAVLSLPTASQELPNEPIAYIGHGAMFDQFGNQLAPTEDFIRSSLSFYENYLLSSLPEERKQEYNSLTIRTLLQSNIGQAERNIVTAEAIGWLVQQADGLVPTQTIGKISLLRFLANRDISFDAESGTMRLNGEFEVGEGISAAINEFRVQNSPDKVIPRSEVPGGQEYRAECLKKGVPVPLEFASGAWKDYGQVPQAKAFIVPGLEISVKAMMSNNPPGLCIALPRHGPESAPGLGDGEVIIDGIICMGRESAEACFWDNQVPGGGDVFTFPLNNPPLVEKWLAGGDLVGGIGGECSDCHAGENPYIVHPSRGSETNGLGDLLDAVGLDLYPSRWHKPYVAMVWPQNPGPIDAPANCTGCHGEADDLLKGDSGRLPDVTSLNRYCGVILRAAVGARAPNIVDAQGVLTINPRPTMPPSKPGVFACTPNLSSDHPNYRACNPVTTVDCTPGLLVGTDATSNTVHCSQAVAELLAQCPK